MYSMKISTPHAKARIEDIDCSYKDLAAVCDNIRGLPVTHAITILGLAAEGKMPILYRSWNKKLGKRRELGGQKGRYPVKTAGIALKLLKSAVANAELKGLDLDRLIVLHASANSKHRYSRMSPKGRRMRSDYVTARAEIILVEAMVPEQIAEKQKEKKAKPAKEVKAETVKTEKVKAEPKDDVDSKEEVKTAKEEPKESVEKKENKPEQKKDNA